MRGDNVREYRTLIELVGENYLQDVSLKKDGDQCFIVSNKTETTIPISSEELEFLKSSTVVKVRQ
jgi:hypothetical protein